jgi:hypothetical protein
MYYVLQGRNMLGCWGSSLLLLDKKFFFCQQPASKKIKSAFSKDE